MLRNIYTPHCRSYCYCKNSQLSAFGKIEAMLNNHFILEEWIREDPNLYNLLRFSENVWQRIISNNIN